MRRHDDTEPPALRERGEAEALVQRLRPVLEGEPTVRWAYLFGSAARGEPFHDLDVAVALVDEARGAVALGRVVAAIEGAVAPVPVDVADLRSVAPAVGGRIAREGRVLLDRHPRDRKQWEAEANSRALDIEPWLARFERLRARALARRAG